MKKSLLVMAMMSSSVFAGDPVPDLVIEGVFDGPITGGVPKFAEVYVVAGGELANCGIGSANNGGGTDGQEFTFPSRIVTAGEHIYIATESVEFMNYFGFAPDYTDVSMGINGDDAVELFCSGVVVDTFGEIDVDGTGQPWDHVDGWAHRINVENPVTEGGARVFDLANWNFSGINATDGCTTNDSCGSVYPAGTLPVELMNFSVE